MLIMFLGKGVPVSTSVMWPFSDRSFTYSHHRIKYLTICDILTLGIMLSPVTAATLICTPSWAAILLMASTHFSIFTPPALATTFKPEERTGERGRERGRGRRERGRGEREGGERERERERERGRERGQEEGREGGRGRERGRKTLNYIHMPTLLFDLFKQRLYTMFNKIRSVAKILQKT